VHVHEKAPTVLVHVFSDDKSLPQAVDAVHSFTSTHDAVKPLPDVWNPVVHPQEYPPVEFVQVFAAERSRPHVVVVAHSLMSAQVAKRPVPEI
jgi:hypothetical protein